MPYVDAWLFYHKSLCCRCAVRASEQPHSTHDQHQATTATAQSGQLPWQPEYIPKLDNSVIKK